MIVFLMFAVLFVLLLVGFPVAFTLGGVATLFSLFTDKGLALFGLLPSRMFGIVSNEMLLAAPLFIYMGVMLEKSGLAEDLLETMALLFGKMRGGMAVAVVIVGALLAASTGIVGATVVTMGMLSLPTMLKRGYSKELATGTIAASGTLGQIIPPSIVLILLASQMGLDIGNVFKAAVTPGLILVGLYLVYALIFAWLKPDAAPAMPDEDLAAFRQGNMVKRICFAFLSPLILIIAVLGSIFAGIASPTEAAGVGALGAMILTILHGRFSLKTLRAVMRETTHLTSMVFIILCGATAFSLVFWKLGGEEALIGAIERSNLGPYAFLALVMLLMFLAGFFIDFIEIIFIFIPVIMPVFRSYEMDPTWLAVVIAMNLQTSFLTPPFGFSLFYLKGVAPPEVRTTHIYRGIIPFIIIQILALTAVIIWPDLALWLTRIQLGQH